MKVKFTQFFDISSSSTEFTSFKVVAGGNYVKQRCAPQFACYKYYKLGPVSVKLVPASTLPVDPTGLSYETGDTTVDPRDMFNPGLVRITNGEYIKPFDTMDGYYATLLDPRWFKFQLQQGFSRYAKPLVYNIGEIHQDIVGLRGFTIPQTNGTINSGIYRDGTSNPVLEGGFEDKAIPFAPIQTGRVRLGWMPTDTNGTDFPDTTVNGKTAFVPEVDVLTFILPKAFKTKFYYRVFVESTVYFKEPVAVNPIIGTDGKVYNPVDRFIGMTITGSNDTYNDGAVEGYRYR